MTSDAYRASLGGDENVRKFIALLLHKSVNRLENIKLYTFNGYIVYMKYIPIKLLCKKKK